MCSYFAELGHQGAVTQRHGKGLPIHANDNYSPCFLLLRLLRFRLFRKKLLLDIITAIIVSAIIELTRSGVVQASESEVEEMRARLRVAVAFWEEDR